MITRWTIARPGVHPEYWVMALPNNGKGTFPDELEARTQAVLFLLDNRQEKKVVVCPVECYDPMGKYITAVNPYFSLSHIRKYAKDKTVQQEIKDI